MIKYIKKIDYYDKKKFLYEEKTEEKTFKTLKEGLKYLKNVKLEYTEERGQNATYENAKIIYFENDDECKIYYKYINTNTKQIETSIL